MRPMLSVAALSFAAAGSAQTPAAPKFATPTGVVADSKPAEWQAIPADDLMVIDLSSGKRVVVQLAPQFAPVHVANIQKLAKGGYWQGAAIYRVQDNYVAQWGNNESEKPLPAAVPSTAAMTGWGASCIAMTHSFNASECASCSACGSLRCRASRRRSPPTQKCSPSPVSTMARTVRKPEAARMAFAAAR